MFSIVVFSNLYCDAMTSNVTRVPNKPGVIFWGSNKNKMAVPGQEN